ncbi:unnamed protein product [Symbiodinium sp. CCMP2592]|nr:unnamed protein product [Symbiodinium sp. CCMP2592]
MAYLIELGVQAPQAHHWQCGDSTLTIDWACHDATRKVWHWLLPLWETVQLQRVSLLEGARDLGSGLDLTGLWQTQQVLSSDDLVFASDASGGPGGRDLRSACVAWAIGAYEITDDGPRRVASITSFPQRPLSVAGAEQQAAYELFARVSGTFDLTVDCKAVAQVVTKKSPPFEGPTPWGLVWSERARARITWVPSHKDPKYYADRGIPEWRRRVNADVDALCGQRAAGVFQAATKPDLVSPSAATGATKATKPLNKKQRMLARLSGDEDSLGHQWVKGAEGSTNMTMKCAICGLYLQQINDLPSFDRLMHHPCKRRGDPLQQWNIHSSHDMINMGVQWSCAKCGRLQRPQHATGAKNLQKPCDGRAPVSQLGKLAQSAGNQSLSDTAPAIPAQKVAVPFGTKKGEQQAVDKGPRQATLKFGSPPALLRSHGEQHQRNTPRIDEYVHVSLPVLSLAGLLGSCAVLRSHGEQHRESYSQVLSGGPLGPSAATLVFLNFEAVPEPYGTESTLHWR